MSKKIGFIGLGKMGFNMVLNLLDNNYEVVVYNRSPEQTKQISKRRAIPSYNLRQLVNLLPEKKIVWLMITSGKPIDKIILKLLPILKKGDIIIDGGNSYYEDSIRRYILLKKCGINFLDVGTSGGIEGARRGACMMIGGEKEIFKKTEHLFKILCVKNGYAYVGNSGAGHFTKMIHNAIEYGMLGALGEGLQVIDEKKNKFKIDLNEVIKTYSHGSIIEGKLIYFLERAWKKDPYFNSILGEIPKGKTENEMRKLAKVSQMPLLKRAILMRAATRRNPSFAGKIISSIRKEFGGHEVKSAK